MKTLLVLIFLFLPVHYLAAQQSSNSAGSANLVVLKKKWSLTIPERGAGDDAFKAIKDQAEAKQDILDTYKPYPVASPRLMDPKFPVESLKTYLYEIKVKNTAGKTVQRVFWDYAFADLNTDEYAGKISFVSKTLIKPGKSVKIVARTNLQPPKNYGKQTRIKLKEEIRVRRIEYSDGSVWSGY